MAKRSSSQPKVARSKANHFGTNAITALDAYAVQSYMGHVHYSTTQRYMHHKPRPEHAQALHEAFGGQQDGTVVPGTRSGAAARAARPD